MIEGTKIAILVPSKKYICAWGYRPRQIISSLYADTENKLKDGTDC